MRLGYILLYVEDVVASMDFYTKAFGLEAGYLHDSKQYGEMITGESKLGFVQHDTASSHGFEYEKMSLRKKPAAFEIAFVADDVAVAFTKAVASGAIVVSPPVEKP